MPPVSPVFFGFIVGMVSGLVLSVGYVVWRTSRVRHWLSQQEAEPREATEEPQEAAVPPTAAEEGPRPMDPLNPPWYATYKPTAPGRSKACTCHQTPIQPGDRVLMWPIPDHPQGGIDIFCSRTYQEALSNG